MNDFMKQFNAHINKCRKCGQPRIEVCCHVLPIQIIKAFESAGENAEYLYCKKCQEYSVIMNF